MPTLFRNLQKRSLAYRGRDNLQTRYTHYSPWFGFPYYNLTTHRIERPSPQGHYGFHSFPVVDWFCLFIYLWVLTFSLEDCSEFGNFVITLIWHKGTRWALCFVGLSPSICHQYPGQIEIFKWSKKKNG
jgi:hypothetical protein